MNNLNSYQPLEGEQQTKSQPQDLEHLPASSNVDPAFLQWAKQKEMVQPGQDGTLPAMDRGGFGIQSMVWGGPMQTGKASVREKQAQKERRELAEIMKKSKGHGEARVVGSYEDTSALEVREEPPRTRKRDMLKTLFSDGAQKRRLTRMMEN